MVKYTKKQLGYFKRLVSIGLKKGLSANAIYNRYKDKGLSKYLAYKIFKKKGGIIKTRFFEFGKGGIGKYEKTLRTLYKEKTLKSVPKYPYMAVVRIHYNRIDGVRDFFDITVGSFKKKIAKNELEDRISTIISDKISNEIESPIVYEEHIIDKVIGYEIMELIDVNDIYEQEITRK